MIDWCYMRQVEREKLQLAMMKEMVGSLEDEYDMEYEAQHGTSYDFDDIPDPADFDNESDKAIAASDRRETPSSKSGASGDSSASASSTTPKEEDKKPKASQPEHDGDDDTDMNYMKSALAGMIKKLEVQINKTESVLGDKLQRLDKDRDGMLNSEELLEVVMSLLKKHPSSEEAVELVRALDKDNDGKGNDTMMRFHSVCYALLDPSC